MYRRNILHQLAAATADTPVVLVVGPRQGGKSTAVRQFAEESSGARYITLDDAAALAAATADPAGFVRGLARPVVIDEVQRAPALFLAIKEVVDRDRQPGGFILTGSADVLLLPRVSESLAGRMEVLTLWPLSQGELEGCREGFIDAVLAPAPPPPLRGMLSREEVLGRAITGGYPEVIARSNPARRAAWFEAYLTTMFQRDVRDLANIEGATLLPRVVSLLAARGASLMNLAEVSRGSGIPYTTLTRYLSLLETTFLVRTLHPWAGNLARRLTRSPKLFLGDSGLLAHVTGVTLARLALDPTAAGPVLENFVLQELRKQAGWADTRTRLSFFRTAAGAEVDFVLEEPSGRAAGVEVKASATIGARDFRGLRTFAEALGDRFARGILLYTGSETVSFGENLVAMPVEALWKLGARPLAD
ncbi:MAG: ATP-binding protein [Chloroflexi bacterium]|nr:ATP-binding protein [Chloroflexota bacterium]